MSTTNERESFQQWVERWRTKSSVEAREEMTKFFDGLPKEFDDGTKFRLWLLPAHELDKFLVEESRQERVANKLWK